MLRAGLFLPPPRGRCRHENQAPFDVVMEAHVHWRLDPEGQDTSHRARPDRECIKKHSIEVTVILGRTRPTIAAMLTDAPTGAAGFVRFPRSTPAPDLDG